MPVTVTIVSVANVSAGDSPTFNDPSGIPDFYTRINIGNGFWFQSGRIDNTNIIMPGWTTTRSVSRTTTGGLIPIRIEILDYDGFGSADDLVDVDPGECVVLRDYGCAILTVGRPAADSRGIDITLNVRTGTFTTSSTGSDAAGAADGTATCATGAESEAATVCFSIALGAPSPEILLVTKLIDTNSGRCLAYNCSLREAVTAADDSDTVAIPDLGGTYDLTFSGLTSVPDPLPTDDPGHLKITQKGLTIRGPPTGAVVRQAIANTRVFEIHGGADVEISNLTITGGQAGRTSTANGAHLHGGGVHNHGKVRLINVTISRNTAPENDSAFGGGGGFYNAGIAELINVTIAENDARTRAGGIDGQSISTMVPIEQTLRNTLLVDNTGDEGNCRVQSISSIGSNLQFPGTTCGPAIATTSKKPVDNRDDSPNGKSTYPLTALGGAIDAGLADLCPPTDQLGDMRPLDGNGDGVLVCDIGAREENIGSIQQPVDVSTGIPGTVTVDFNPITMPGKTVLRTSSTGPLPPLGYREGSPQVYYDLSTDAKFTRTVVCIEYMSRNFSDERDLRLFHSSGGGWHDVTISLDTAANQICGRTTTLAKFAIFEANQIRQ